VAFIWGPVAGWLNTTKYQGRFRIQPTDGEGLQWPVAIGFAKRSTELRDQVDAALPGLELRMRELAVKYGFPTAAPIKLAAGGSAPIEHASAPPEQKRTVGQAAATANAAPPSTPTEAAAPTAPADAEAVTAGHEIFNGTCAHCHGPDAIQSERRIDLRRLKLRYGETVRDTFWRTVHEGRPAKGMPAWKDVFDDTQLDQVYAYLMTVQSN